MGNQSGTKANDNQEGWLIFWNLSYRIIKLIVSGPAGISFQKISTEDYIIKWTPTQKEMNGHFPICFFSEALGRWEFNKSRNVCMSL